MADEAAVEGRRERLLDLIRARGFVSGPSLAEELEVSLSTIRRDLDFLEASGSARRTRGGAYYTGSPPKLAHFQEQQQRQWAEKQVIAEKAGALVRDGEVVLIDGGSTALETARRLAGRDVKVITNSLPVAELFTADGAGGAVILGGPIDPRTGVVQGGYALEMLSGLRANWAIVSAAGVSPDGVFNDNVLLVETERAMIAAADAAMVVADHTKFGRRSLVRVCGVEEVDQFVSDDAVAPEWREAMLAQGVSVI